MNLSDGGIVLEDREIAERFVRGEAGRCQPR
jgi:hypothetical protein